MILVLSRCNEVSGTQVIQRTLARLRPDRVRSVSRVSHLLRDLLLRGDAVDGILALSDTEYVVAVCATQLLGRRVPIVLCVYNPKQWLVTLDASYCAHRARIFRRLLSQISERNIVYCNEPVLLACRQIAAVAAKGTVIVAPVEKPLAASTPGTRRRNGAALEIVTVGRFVDFKVASILTMIDVLEALDARGVDVGYSLYGAGPLEDQVAARIVKSTIRGKIRLKGVVAPERFEEEIRGYDLFFGMGTALVRAAMLGVPALIAIEDETRPCTYGFLGDIDHCTRPTFGERNADVPRQSLQDVVAGFAARSDAQRAELSARDRAAAEAYDAECIVERMVDFVAQSEVTDHSRVSPLDLAVIRMQTWVSRLRNRPRIQA